MVAPRDAAYIGAYLSTFLFGAYNVVAYHCSVVMYHRYKIKRLHMYLLGTHIALFLLINWRCIANMARSLHGIFHISPDGTINLHPTWSAWSLVENTPWIMSVIVADAFIVYRTYIVWSQNYLIVAIPLLLFVVDFGAAIFLLVGMASSKTTLAHLIHLTAAFAAATLAANLICTVLISLRIWRVRSNMSGLTREGLDPLSGVVKLIVESAAIYTVVLIAEIIALGVGSAVYDVLFDIQSPIIGIVFSMIIIRVSRGQAQGDTSESTDGTIAWRHSSTEESVQIRLQTINVTRSDVEAQHEGPKVSTKTNFESSGYKP